jgi:hypothetical protein
VLRMRRCSAGLDLRGFQGNFGRWRPLEEHWGFASYGVGWLNTGGVLVQTSGGCIWCGVPGTGFQGLLFKILRMSFKCR